jgi:hypothetical protein
MPTVLSSHSTALSKIKFLGRLARAATRGLTTHARSLRRTENRGLRTLLVLVVLASSAGIAQAQQIEVAGGLSILESPKPNTASLAYVPPSESGGVYAGFSLQYLTENLRGLNFEGAFRVKEGLYNGSQFFRPILYNVNYVYARRFAPKFRGDFMAGIGGETLLFYNQIGCGYASGCRTYVNSNHFLVHLGFGLHYTPFRNKKFHNIFLLPEAHYYFIPNNFEFHSDHVLRAGASIGYTFGGAARK